MSQYSASHGVEHINRLSSPLSNTQNSTAAGSSTSAQMRVRCSLPPWGCCSGACVSLCHTHLPSFLPSFHCPPSIVPPQLVSQLMYIIGLSCVCSTVRQLNKAVEVERNSECRRVLLSLSICLSLSLILNINYPVSFSLSLARFVYPFDAHCVPNQSRADKSVLLSFVLSQNGDDEHRLTDRIRSTKLAGSRSVGRQN